MPGLKWFANGSIALIPGGVYFTSYPPPIFPGISILVSAAALVIVYIACSSENRKQSREQYLRKIRNRAIITSISAFALLMIYVIILRHCTVFEPQEYSTRFQIGFGKCSWGLTEVGLRLLRDYPSATVETWMEIEAAFRPGGPEIIWKPITILAAGIASLILYAGAFVLWTIGFSLLAKHRDLKKKRNS